MDSHGKYIFSYPAGRQHPSDFSPGPGPQKVENHRSANQPFKPFRFGKKTHGADVQGQVHL